MTSDYTNITLNDIHFNDIDSNSRLDKILSLLYPDISRNHLQAIITQGDVTVDSVPCLKCSKKIMSGQLLSIKNDSLHQNNVITNCVAENIPLDIVYEDDAIIVINKPAGIVTHPGHGNQHGTLQSALLYHHSNAENLARGGIVHRLDKDTCGLMVVAKTEKAQNNLIKQFEVRSIHREYLAIVFGTPEPTGIIKQPIGKSRHNPMKMAIRLGQGKEAITYFQVQQKWRGFSLLKCQLKTGRTHQIRLHLEHHCFPIVGDAIYKKRARPLPFEINRQMLQAVDLRLLHPITKTSYQWQIDPADDMLWLINHFNENNQR